MAVSLAQLPSEARFEVCHVNCADQLPEESTMHGRNVPPRGPKLLTSPAVSLDSISTSAPSDCPGDASWPAVCNSRLGSTAIVDQARDTSLFTDSGRSAAHAQHCWLAPLKSRSNFSRYAASGSPPHRRALRRVPRVPDFRAALDLERVGELPPRPAFACGQLRRVPKSHNFEELEGVPELQVEMEAEDLESL